VTALAALSSVAACGDDDRGTAAPVDATTPPIERLSVKPRLPAGARTHEDRRDRLRVKLPGDWHRATDRATDRVSLVADVLLAAGTSPIRPRRGAACSDQPDEPRVDVGPTDALVVIEEDVRSRADGARKRPRFQLLRQVAPPGGSHRARTGVFPSWHCRSEVGVSGVRETVFADGGRVFSVTAIIGKAASRQTASEALAVLDSFTPLEDSPRASP